MFKVIYKTSKSNLVIAKIFHTQARAMEQAQKLINVNLTNREVHVEVVKAGKEEGLVTISARKRN